MVWSVEHVPTPHFFPYAPPDWVPGIYEGIKDIPQSTFVWGCIEWLESHGMLLLLATLSLMAISRCCLAIDEKDDDQPLGKKLATKSQLLSHMRQAPLIFVSLISTVFIYIYTGWWFQTFFTFHNIWDNPSHWRTHIFEDGYCTTNQYIWCYLAIDIGSSCFEIGLRVTSQSDLSGGPKGEGGQEGEGPLSASYVRDVGRPTFLRSWTTLWDTMGQNMTNTWF